MTLKEKALELIGKFYYRGIDEYSCKQCALVLVDELIYETQFEVPNIRQKWWIEVKKEIEKL
jgi:hypothetical protein